MGIREETEVSIKRKSFISVSEDNRLLRYRVTVKIKGILASLFRFLLLIAIGYVILYPLLYMISNSVRTGQSYYDPSITWITTKVTHTNFLYAIKAMNFGKAFLNTVFYELVAAVLQLASCAIVAYGFARFEFKEKKILLAILFLTILLPTQATMLPTYVSYSHLDLFGILGKVYEWTGTDLRPSILNTPFVFYLPAFLGVGLRSGIVTYIYIQFFKGLPHELEEAAWIDGCDPIKTFIRIAIPSSTVVIFTNLIFSVIWHWNDYFSAAMYLKDREHFTLAVQLGELSNSLELLRFTVKATSPETGSILMAGCLLYVLPVLIMYLCLQTKFVKSIDRVGITG